jgi:hypothetical protein
MRRATWAEIGKEAKDAAEARAAGGETRGATGSAGAVARGIARALPENG